MFTSIWSFIGWKVELLPKPPPVTVTDVRIPADGTSHHLLSLTTTTDSKFRDSFLFHVPGLRQYWSTEEGWEFHDLQRLDLLQDERIPRLHHLRQKEDLQRLLFGSLSCLYIDMKRLENMALVRSAACQLMEPFWAVCRCFVAVD
jgi:hypothetical protein